MFRQQPASRSVHPYQTTIVPRSSNQHDVNTQQRAKYPWLDDTTSVSYTCAGTDSSNSEQYNVPHYSNDRECVDAPSSPVYHSPYSEGEGKWPVGVRRPPEPDATYTLPPYRSARAVSPPMPTLHYPEPVVARTPDPPAIGGCGGHCPGFEYVCYYVLQIMFVVGILTGVSLCLAGAVLRRSNRGGDLGVLVYIGCLSSLVCAVLLGVQCCVRRDLRRRKRHQPHLPISTTTPTHTMPLNIVPEWSAAADATGDRNTLTLTQMRPLLHNPSTISHHSVYKPTVCPNEEMSGIPWWRRQN